MATKSLIPAGTYGLVELNKLQSVKDGNIVSQYELDATDFATIPAENGMLLAVNHVAKSVELPADGTTYSYLVASVEKDYENKGRKYFAVKRGEFLPRLFKLNKGDIFETNACTYSDVTYANYAAIKAAINTTTVYGVPQASGYVSIVAAPAGTETVVLKAVEAVTLPNGSEGIKFVVEEA